MPSDPRACSSGPEVETSPTHRAPGAVRRPRLWSRDTRCRAGRPDSGGCPGRISPPPAIEAPVAPVAFPGFRDRRIEGLEMSRWAAAPGPMYPPGETIRTILPTPWIFPLRSRDRGSPELHSRNHSISSNRMPETGSGGLLSFELHRGGRLSSCRRPRWISAAAMEFGHPGWP